ncbi:methionyl aminopeptidase [Ereboglobus sp. PH5-5]|uniref:type I methionyl aminopeptidase n=1 Tax=Ereboglobus sp. PH5-5 TaxID=2940529 RepID=UPI002406C805|nr:type I methionyl aminopeptidase [Ereboglobus sp. PH5-5]MDF9833886.1 methionyl aminopeptidase [Ereboglobus sp. PH5-5]
MAIPIKNKDAIARMRESCAIAATVLHRLKQAVQPGISTFDLDDLARKYIEEYGAKSACYGYPSHSRGVRPFPAYACISVNEEVVHGIGSFKRILRDGDVVTLDICVTYNGYVGDNAYTVPVGAVSPEVAKLLRVTEEARAAGIAQAKVGNRIGDISEAVQNYITPHGYGIVRDMVGHGVGASMHEEPQIPNFIERKKSKTDVIKPGMTLAIEPMINLGSWRTKTAEDGWTIVTADGSPSAHFEHTVLTTDHGPEILTVPRP